MNAFHSSKSLGRLPLAHSAIHDVCQTPGVVVVLLLCVQVVVCIQSVTGAHNYYVTGAHNYYVTGAHNYYVTGTHNYYVTGTYNYYELLCAMNILYVYLFILISGNYCR